MLVIVFLISCNASAGDSDISKEISRSGREYSTSDGEVENSYLDENAVRLSPGDFSGGNVGFSISAENYDYINEVEHDIYGLRIEIEYKCTSLYGNGPRIEIYDYDSNCFLPTSDLGRMDEWTWFQWTPPSGNDYTQDGANPSFYINIDAGWEDDVHLREIKVHWKVKNNAPQKPIFDCGLTYIRAGDPTAFSYTSTDDEDGDSMYYKFDWGDGTYSEWGGPIGETNYHTGHYTWSEPGKYGIRSKLKDFFGKEGPWSDKTFIKVNHPPTIKIIGPDAVLPFFEYDYEIDLYDYEDDGMTFIKAWSWWLGDYTIPCLPLDDEQNYKVYYNCFSGQHIFAKKKFLPLKVYSLETKLTDQIDCVLEYKNVHCGIIFWLMDILFGSDSYSALKGEDINFNATIYGGTPPYEYTWSFGDGSDLEFSQNVSHTYLEAGEYEVSLTVIDSKGYRETKITTAIIGGVELVATPSQVTKNNPMVFTTNLINIEPSYNPYYVFDIQGQVIEQYENNYTHCYNEEGTYTESVTVYDGQGGTELGTGTVTVIVNPFEIDIGGPYAGEVNRPINFNGAVYGHTSSNLEAYWEFGDGGESTGFDVTHTYSEEFTEDYLEYAVSLTVEDPDTGWSGVKATNVKVWNEGYSEYPPEADAGGPYCGSPNTPIVFDGSNSDGFNLVYYWKFSGDDEWTSSGSTPTYSKSFNPTSYALPAYYTVSLKVEDSLT